MTCYSQEVRGVLYSLDIASNTVTIGEKTFNKGDKDYDKMCVFVMEVIDSPEFRKVLELGDQLRINEQKVGKDVLKRDYASAYKKLVETWKSAIKEYIFSYIDGPWHRFAKIWLKDFFESEEFQNALNSFTKNELKTVLVARDIEAIPITILNSELMSLVMGKDNLLGNFQINCDENLFVTTILHCSANCPKYKECSVWKNMKEKDSFNYNLNMEFLEENTKTA